MNLTFKLVWQEEITQTAAERDQHWTACDPLVHNTAFHILICRTCRHMVHAPYYHLRVHHSELSLAQRRWIVARHAQDVIVQLDQVSLPIQPIAIVPELHPPVRVIQCWHSGCDYIGGAETVRKHAQQKHQWRRSKDGGLTSARSLLAQSLRGPGVLRSYFEVIAPVSDQLSPTPEVGQQTVRHQQNSDNHESEDDEDLDEQRRLLLVQDDAPALGLELDLKHESHWLQGCGWPIWFAEKSLLVLTSTARGPTKPLDELVLGDWHGVSCTSPAADEACLINIIIATEAALQRCEETVRETPRFFRCWLRSWGPAFLPYPFELLQTENSRQKYFSYWRRFICYIFRAYRVCLRMKERTQDVFGFTLSPAQQQMISRLWRDFSELPPDSHTTDKASRITLSTQECLFQLFVMFWTDNIYTKPLEQSPIVHFSGVLGVHPHELAYRSAYDYTTFLAALIWMGRLILLEYALPLRGYRYLPHQWPPRTAYPDQIKRLREEIRPRFLIRGSPSPIGYLIERLQHGRAVARREGGKAQISWSLDHQTLTVNDHQIRITQFRDLIHESIVRAQQKLEELLFGFWPEISLNDVRDDLVRTQPGYSFLQHSDNRLQSQWKHLYDRAVDQQKVLGWKGKQRLRAKQYLQACDQMTELLYGAIHLTSGMPARCEELRTIRWANTATQLRNVFVFRGKLILIFTYNKAITHHNNAFYVVRTPCPAIQQVLFIWLVYIRPFRDAVARRLKVTAANSSNTYLFTRYQDQTACFTSSKCLQSLRASTTNAPFAMSTAIYRQIAVSIAKKHLPALARPFDAHLPHDQSGILTLLAFQTGHKPSTQAHSYAIEKEFPSRLQPQLIEKYDINSNIWHEFNLIRADDVIDYEIIHKSSRLRVLPAIPAFPASQESVDSDQARFRHQYEHGEENDQISSSLNSDDEAQEEEDTRDENSDDSESDAENENNETDQEEDQDDEDIIVVDRRTQIATSTAHQASKTQVPTKKRSRNTTRNQSPESPGTKRIKTMQAELEKMLQERRRRKR